MLTFNALWIDDTPSSAEAKIEGIRDFLDGEGFVFKHTLREDGNDLDGDLDNPELDIVITDFNLTGITAQELITKVRDQHKYIELIMYSEDPPEEFEEVLRNFQGLYGCTRADVEDTIIDVIKYSIRRTHNVNNMRGVVISEAIDIENQVEEAILSYFRKEKDLAEKVLKYELCDFGKKIFFLNSIMKKIHSYLSRKSSDTKLDNDIRKGWEAKRSEVHALRDVCKRLPDEVMKPRNMLAHVGHKIDDSKKQYLQSMQKGYENIMIDSDWCKDKRKHLAEHVGNLTKVVEFINNNNFDWDV